jgi:hypoxanthine phosphoribosyltransferase
MPAKEAVRCSRNPAEEAVDLMTIHDDIDRVLLDEATIQRRVAELGTQIAHDYQGQPLILVGILRGAVMFLADLARAIAAPVALDFVAVSSYGDATQSQGRVRILKDLDESIAGQHVLLIEDIIDTGLTLTYLLDLLRQRQPASLRVCALLDKAKVRTKHITADYIGFPVEDAFVVGYGLDYAQQYRNLPYIGVLKPAIYQS